MEPSTRFVARKIDGDLFDFVRDAARNVFDAQSSHAPTFILQVPDHVGFVVVPWSTREQKHAAVTAMRHFCQMADASAVAIAVEAWMVIAPPDVRKEDALEIVPSESPDRQEVLWVLRQDSKGERAGYYEIVRESEGVARCGAWHELPGQQCEGIFTNMVGSRRILN